MNPTSAASERPLASRLAEKICSFGQEAATSFALQQARTAIIDTVAVTLAGSAENCAQILMNTAGVASAPGSSLIFGTDRRTSALDATLVNGTASHALDYDDFSGVFGGKSEKPTPAGIAIFDHPSNPRHPTRWYLSDNAGLPYFGPALLFAQPMTLKAGDSFTLKYRILVHPGLGDHAALEKEYEAFAK